jgi:hypothetical protein
LKIDGVWDWDWNQEATQVLVLRKEIWEVHAERCCYLVVLGAGLVDGNVTFGERDKGLEG